jgi:hypothetical protein
MLFSRHIIRMLGNPQEIDCISREASQGRIASHKVDDRPHVFAPCGFG